MTKHFLPALATVAFLAGCTANVSGTVTPGGTTGTTGATGSTSTSTTTTVNTGAATGALADLYKVGRVWEYDVTNPTGTGTQRQEVMEVKDNKATIKTTVTVLGQTNSSTSTIDLTKSDATATIPTDANTVLTFAGNPTAESITVKAGTYDVMHGKGTTKTTASGNTVNSDFEFWTSTKVGLVKSITSTKLDIAVPNIPNLPAGVSIPGLPTSGGTGGSGGITTTIELTKFQ
jgi:hypothetical protein